MDDASKIALVTGFGGVMLGGVITYLSELHFRNQQEKKLQKKNFLIVVAEIGRVYTEQQSILKNLIQSLPQDKPILLWPLCRQILMVDTPVSALSTEILFALKSNKKSYYSEVELFFRRFNSNISTFGQYNKLRTKMNDHDGILGIALDEDLARVEFNLSDEKTLKDIYQLENLLRTLLRHFCEDLESGRDLVENVNVLWKNNYSKKEKEVLELPDGLEIPVYLTEIKNFTLRDLPPFQQL